MEYPAYSGPPERDKAMNYGPPEENLSPPDQNKVTKYSWMLEMYSGPPERDKVTSSGPPEANLSPPEQNKVTKYPLMSGTHSGPPEGTLIH